MMLGMIVGTVAIVLVTVVIGLLVDRKAPVLPVPETREDAHRKRQEHGAGESPATALQVRESGLDKLREVQRCPECRSAMRQHANEVVRYDGADLHVIRYVCTRCAGARTVYVATR